MASESEHAALDLVDDLVSLTHQCANLVDSVRLRCGILLDYSATREGWVFERKFLTARMHIVGQLNRVSSLLTKVSFERIDDWDCIRYAIVPYRPFTWNRQVYQPAATAIPDVAESLIEQLSLVESWNEPGVDLKDRQGDCATILGTWDENLAVRLRDLACQVEHDATSISMLVSADESQEPCDSAPQVRGYRKVAEVDRLATKKFKDLWRISNASQWARELNCDRRTVMRLSAWAKAKDRRDRWEGAKRSARRIRTIPPEILDAIFQSSSASLNRLAPDVQEHLDALPDANREEILSLLEEQLADDA